MLRRRLNYPIQRLQQGSKTRNPSLSDSLLEFSVCQTILKIVGQLSLELKAQPPDHRWISKV